MSEPLLQIERLYKAYGTHLVLRNINLDVAEHEVVCLIGASGCGKSTLLRCINLLEDITAGQILLEGEPISGDSPNANRIRQRVGLVFQAFNLFPHMTVIDNITLAPRKVLGLSRKEAERDGLALLDRLDLPTGRRSIRTGSPAGSSERVAIIRALALRPQLLMLDEVTSALDPEMVGEVLGVIAELKGLGMTMILATHQMSFARQIADRVAFLDNGVILEEGPPERIFTSPQEPRTRQFLERILAAEPNPAVVIQPA